MKKLVEISLILGTILFGTMVIRLSSLPILTILPDSMQEFWIVTDNTRTTYSLLYDISVGFLLSTMFYTITVIMPNKIKNHKAKKLISSKINSLMQNIEVIISLTAAKYGCPSNFKLLTEKDFLILDGDTITTKSEISYHISVFNKKNKRITGSHQPGTLNDVIKAEIDKLFENLKYIQSFEYFYIENTDLVECLRTIETYPLFKNYKKQQPPKKEFDCFLYSDTAKKMAELVQIYLKLKKLNLNTQYSITTLDTEEECSKYRKERQDGTLLEQVISIQKNAESVALNNPTLILHSSKYNTKILVQQLKKQLILSSNHLKNINSLNELKQYKYLILVVDSDSAKDVQSVCNQINFEVTIIFLFEQQRFRPLPKMTINNKVLNIINITYKSSSHILNRITFYNTEPSKHNIYNIALQIKEIIQP